MTGSGIWETTGWRWNRGGGRERVDGVIPVPRRAAAGGLTSRRHVDFGRVRSAICPAVA